MFRNLQKNVKKQRRMINTRRKFPFDEDSEAISFNCQLFSGITQP